MASIGLFLSYFEIQQRPVLFSVLKVQLVEAADTREHDAVVKLLHVAPSLHHHCGVGGLILAVVKRFQWGPERALGEILQLDCRPRLLAADLARELCLGLGSEGQQRATPGPGRRGKVMGGRPGDGGDLSGNRSPNQNRKPSLRTCSAKETWTTRGWWEERE